MDGGKDITQVVVISPYVFMDTPAISLLPSMWTVLG